MIKGGYYFGIDSKAKQLADVNSSRRIDKEMEFLERALGVFCTRPGFDYVHTSGIFVTSEGIGFSPLGLGLGLGEKLMDFEGVRVLIDFYVAKKRLLYSQKSPENAEKLALYATARTREKLLSMLPECVKVTKPKPPVDRVKLATQMRSCPADEYPYLMQIIQPKFVSVGEEVEIDVNDLSESTCQKLEEYFLEPDPIIPDTTYVLASIAFMDKEEVVEVRVRPREEEEIIEEAPVKHQKVMSYEENIANFLDMWDILSIITSMNCSMEKRKAIISECFKAGRVDEEFRKCLLLFFKNNEEWMQFMNSF
jgi:predicted nucleic-acid-binding protein